MSSKGYVALPTTYTELLKQRPNYEEQTATWDEGEPTWREVFTKSIEPQVTDTTQELKAPLTSFVIQISFLGR